MRNNIAVVKDLATNLIDQLKRQGISIKRTGALEVISHLQNHTDWNRYRAKLTSENRPRQLQKSDVNTKVVLGITGVGKTEVLKSILSLEDAEGSSQSLYICFSGAGLWYEHGRDPFLPKNINRWKVTHSPCGLIEIVHPEILVEGPHIVNISSDRLTNQEGLLDAFRSFMTLHQADLSYSRIGSILVDEFLRLNPALETQFFRVISDFCAIQKHPVRRLVIASQREIESNSNISGMLINQLCDDLTRRLLAIDLPFTEFVPICGDKNWRSTSIDDDNLVYDIFSAVTQVLARKPRRGQREQPDLGRFSYFVNGPEWVRALIPKSKAS